MTTKCYLYNIYDVDFMLAVCEIIEDFPCFIEHKKLEGEAAEVYIKCRIEDLGAIEKVLASVV